MRTCKTCGGPLSPFAFDVFCGMKCRRKHSQNRRGVTESASKPKKVTEAEAAQNRNKVLSGLSVTASRKRCRYCGGTFIARDKKSRYCTGLCRGRASRLRKAVDEANRVPLFDCPAEVRKPKNRYRTKTVFGGYIDGEFVFGERLVANAGGIDGFAVMKVRRVIARRERPGNDEGFALPEVEVSDAIREQPDRTEEIDQLANLVAKNEVNYEMAEIESQECIGKWAE